jgi:hypothetical protein
VGDLYLAMNRREEGISFFAMALLATPLSLGNTTTRLSTVVADPAERSRQLDQARTRLRQLQAIERPRPQDASGRVAAFVLIGSGGRVEDVRFVSGEPALMPLVEALLGTRVPSRMPLGSPAKLVRRVDLACAISNDICTGLLAAASAVQAVEAK